LKQEMRQRKYSRVVVDSLTSLKFFYIKTSEENSTLISFFRLLSDLGVTSLLTVQLPEISKPEVEVHVARGEIRLHKWIDGRGITRGVTIEKFRGSSHDSTLRSMKISSDGVTVKTLAGEKAGKESEAKEEGTAPPAQEEASPAAPAPPNEPPPPQAEALPPPDQAQETPPPPPPDISHEGGSGI
jgi:KaiC/GvpD/RAD55 family RecA-like ATPase